jgi:hypothetical protein
MGHAALDIGVTRVKNDAAVVLGHRRRRYGRQKRLVERTKPKANGASTSVRCASRVVDKFVHVDAHDLQMDSTRAVHQLHRLFAARHTFAVDLDDLIAWP